MVAATVVLSVATTLITLAAENMRQARHTPAATTDLPPVELTTPSAMPAFEAGEGDILASHHYRAGHGRLRTDIDDGMTRWRRPSGA
jgi:hypothetical protein